MKKTLRTVITAAMFAAANMSAIPAAAGEANAVPQFRNDTEREVYRNFSPVYGPGPTYEVTTTTADIEEVLTTTTTTDYPVPLYGTQPPRTTTSDLQGSFVSSTTTTTVPVYGVLPPRTTTTTIDRVDPINNTTTSINLDEILTTTTTQPQPVYGPPLQDWVGDVNLDGYVDSFDVVAVRKMLVKGTQNYAPGSTMEAYYGDMNNDGKLSIADLLLLQQYVLGKISKSELQQKFGYWYGSHNVPIEQIYPPVPGTAPENNPIATTTTTYEPIQDVVVTLYGIAPIKDVIKDFTAKDTFTQEDQPQDTTSQEK